MFDTCGKPTLLTPKAFKLKIDDSNHQIVFANCGKEDRVDESHYEGGNSTKKVVAICCCISFLFVF